MLAITTATKKVERTFIYNGFSNWNDIGRTLGGHQRSEHHQEAKLKLNMLAKQQPVTALLDAQVKADRVRNSEQLVIVVRALKFVARQNIALRGVTTKKVTIFNQLPNYTYCHLCSTCFEALHSS